MNDEYPHEHVNTWEKENEERFNQESSEVPAVNAEAPENSDMVIEKTVIRNASTPAPASRAGTVPGGPEMLLGMDEIQHFRERWSEIQAKFVDEPGSSVREADALVTEVMNDISQMFANQRRTLEGHWNQSDVATEDLRQILMSYRAFFNHLLI